MKHRLYDKFLLTYILIGIFGFILVTFVGSIVIENYLEDITRQSLYQEAICISENTYIRKALLEDDHDKLEENLRSIACYTNETIWIMDTQNQIYLVAPSGSYQKVSSHFHPADWTQEDYTTGDFYGYFASDRLSVAAPIIVDGSTIGYVVIHFLMSLIYERRSTAVMISQFLFFLFYLICSVLLIFYYQKIHKPMQQITEGVNQFAIGKLSYKIPVHSDDEMGHLAQALNYMSDRLNQNGKHQNQFVSNVSHDFRSPLTSIKGYIVAILDGTIPKEYEERYLRIIVSETERLEKLTQSLVTLNDLDIKKRSLQISSFDINQCIHSTISVFEGICKKRAISLVENLVPGELFVSADKTQIQQVLYNLLDNAIKFSDNNTAITFTTTRSNNKIFVSIKDCGIGISKENLPQIWDRFFKTDPSRGKDRTGTGLGLSIVKEIILAHEQTIDVISTEGIGTEFVFTLNRPEK